MRQIPMFQAPHHSHKMFMSACNIQIKAVACDRCWDSMTNAYMHYAQSTINLGSSYIDHTCRQKNDERVIITLTTPRKETNNVHYLRRPVSYGSPNNKQFSRMHYPNPSKTWCWQPSTAFLQSETFRTSFYQFQPLEFEWMTDKCIQIREVEIGRHP